MKKTLSLAFTTLALTFGFSVHAEDESNWYLGAQYSAQEVTSLPDRKFKTVGVVGGYQYNKYFALETRYNTGISGYSSQFYVNGSSDAEYKEDIDKQASLFIRASYPLFNLFGIYALAGVTKSKYEITTRSSHTDLEGNTTTTYPYIIKLSESGFTYGVGLNYQITETVTLFIDYQILPGLTIGSGSSAKWKSMNLGVNYSF
ncbi:porin family protein [Colwellia sp. TT2012]|uniref:porin family protein n=1 Tax=Colwellia sp. TT2012 TaxID=1720342 RepID=UPI000709C578|nr:porin family protein [Colwellia sp. TT2012]